MATQLTTKELDILGVSQEVLDDVSFLDEVSTSSYFMDSSDLNEVVSSLCGGSLGFV